MGRVIDKSDHMESTGVELMKIFSARHGETEWNRLNKICGRTDIPLTEKGIAQAEAMAEKATSYVRTDGHPREMDQPGSNFTVFPRGHIWQRNIISVSISAAQRSSA